MPLSHPFSPPCFHHRTRLRFKLPSQVFSPSFRYNCGLLLLLFILLLLSVLLLLYLSFIFFCQSWFVAVGGRQQPSALINIWRHNFTKSSKKYQAKMVTFICVRYSFLSVKRHAEKLEYSWFCEFIWILFSLSMLKYVLCTYWAGILELKAYENVVWNVSTVFIV